jgi:hypothetical protein
MPPITRIKAGVGSDRIPCNGQYRGEVDNASRFSLEGLQILLFSNEGDPREPIHIHVRCHGARAKFWLNPVALAENIGFAAHELSEMTRVVGDNQDVIEKAWHEHFGE